MASFEILWAFGLAAALFAFIPGPAMLYAAARTLAGGRQAGLWAAVGIACGGMVHAVAAALGLSAVFHAVPTLFVIVKFCGAAYLVWLGIGMIRSGIDLTPGAAPSTAQAFRQSVLVEVLNPKTALFFIAFLPQFADPAAAFPVAVQLMVLGLIVVVLFGLGDLIAIFGASALTQAAARRPGLMAWAGRGAGGILVALGLRLALERSAP